MFERNTFKASSTLAIKEPPSRLGLRTKLIMPVTLRSAYLISGVLRYSMRRMSDRFIISNFVNDVSLPFI